MSRCDHKQHDHKWLSAGFGPRQPFAILPDFTENQFSQQSSPGQHGHASTHANTAILLADIRPTVTPPGSIIDLASFAGDHVALVNAAVSLLPAPHTELCSGMVVHLFK